MRWYITGPSFMMLAAAVGAFNRREVTPPENRGGVLAESIVLFAVEAVIIVLDSET